MSEKLAAWESWDAAEVAKELQPWSADVDQYLLLLGQYDRGEVGDECLERLSALWDGFDAEQQAYVEAELGSGSRASFREAGLDTMRQPRLG